MTEEPAEPKRVIHEVCKPRLGWTEYESVSFDDDSDSLARVSTDGVIIVASVTMFEHETYDPPPWIRFGIENKGWWIRHRKAPPTGLTFHGAVDWKTVALALAEAVNGHKKPSVAEQAALDNFGIALAEEALAQDSHQAVETESEEQQEEDG